MNAIAQPTPPAFRPDLDSHVKDVETFQRSRAGRLRLYLRLSMVGNVLLFGTTVAGLYGLDQLIPTVRVVPVFAWARPDGTIDSAVTTSELPDSITQAETRAALWRYVEERESYSWPEARSEYDIASAMSAPTVRDAYQRSVSGKNPTSPMAKYGKTGTIRIDYVSSSLSGDQYTVHFTRSVQSEEASKPVLSRWTATLDYETRDTVPLAERLTFNPTGVLITSYPGAEQIGDPYNAY